MSRTSVITEEYDDIVYAIAVWWDASVAAANEEGS